MEKFEDYYFGRLGEKEAAEFRQELVSDTGVQEEYKYFKALMNGLEYGIATELKENMDTWESELQHPRSGRVLKLRRVLSVAASLLLLVGFLSVNIIYSDGSLAERNSSEFILSPTRDVPSQEELYYSIYNLYEKGDYESVIQEAGKMESGDKFYGEALILQAKANHKLGNKKEAKELYSSSLSFFNNAGLQVAEEIAEYDYLMFLLDTEGTSEEFKSLHNLILADKDHLYNEKAEDLDRQLKSFWRKLVIF